jgi:hypothetical protein
MRGAKFNIEIYGDQTFTGYTDDEDWNGWACPYSTFNESQKIVDAHRKTGQNAGYDKNSDTFSLKFKKMNFTRQ